MINTLNVADRYDQSSSGLLPAFSSACPPLNPLAPTKR